MAEVVADAEVLALREHSASGAEALAPRVRSATDTDEAGANTATLLPVVPAPHTHPFCRPTLSAVGEAGGE